MSEIFDKLVGDFNTSMDSIGSGSAPTPQSRIARPINSAAGQIDVTGKPASGDGEFYKGFTRSFAEVPGLIAGMGAYAADVFGADNARDTMLQFAKDRQQKVEEQYGSDAASFSNVMDGKADFTDFLKNSSGYVVGQALQSILTGGVGSAVVKGMAKGGIVAAGEKFAADQLAKGVAPELAKKATEDFLKGEATKAGFKGFTLASGAQNLNMEIGSIYPDAVEQAQKEGRTLDGGDLFRVGAAGAAAAATDTAMDRLALGKVLGGSKSPGSFAGRAAREVPAGMARESATEGIQTELERYGAGKSLTDAEAMRDVIDSAAVGAIGGGQAGVLTAVHKKAEEPNSPLSRAVVSTGVLDQPGVTPTQSGVDQTQTGSTDPISQRVQAAVQTLESTDTLQKLRDLGPSMGADNLASDFLYALQVARDPRSRPDQREAAINQVEQAMEWTKTGFTMPQEQPQQPGTAVALRENNAVGPIGQAQFFDPNTIDGEFSDVSNQIGRNGAAPQQLTNGQQTPPKIGVDASPTGTIRVDESGNAAPETRADRINTNQVAGQIAEVNRGGPGFEQQVQPGQQPADAETRADVRATQKFAADSANQDSSPVAGMTEVKAPRVAIPAGEGSALMRKRKAVVEQLAANGFETVQRDGKDFYMVNAKTGQKFKLDGPADAQMARKAINDRIDKLAHTAAASPKNELKEPTQAQIDAGNYKKSDVIDLNGMKIRIENPQGSVRRGVSPEGKAWETKMAHHYGEFQGTVGADGDKLDVFLGPRKDSDKVYVIDQVNQDGTFDEHKVMMGFTSQDAAREGYLANYDKGWTGLGAMTEMSVDQFKTWSKSRAAKKPAAAVLTKAAAAENFTAEEKADEKALFTVPDGGKKRTLKKVSKAKLPKKSSSSRLGEPRPISQDEAAAIEQMAAILGKSVVFYETADNQGRLADGFVNPGQPGVIYVATETTVNPVAIFGHEFYHTLRETNPEAWNAIAKVVSKRVKNATGFRADYYGDKAAAERGDAELGKEQGGELEELISDLGGNLMMDASFWGDVFAQIQKDNGKDAKGIIARLAAAIQQMVARVVAAINQGGFAANDFVDDIDAIRTEFAKALAGHIQRAGVSKSAMDAEIKKSVIRVSAEQKALEEFAEVDAKHRGTDQWMKAPNGQPTQLTERQWIQVRTPSFKNWFGDWEAFSGKQGGVWNDSKGEVSKVVDDNGEPLVVYHGTSKGGFSEFKTPGGTGRGDLGIFTTPNLEMAKTYNKRGSTKEIKFSDMDRDAIEGGDTPGFYASFVNIRNPYETDFEGALWNGERPEQWIVVNEDGETQYTRTGNQFFDSEARAQEFANSVGGEVEAAPDHWETTDDAVREARGSKNDGVIIRSVIDDGGGYSSYFNEPSDVFVALDPNQLKSATQNTGEFSKRTDDMRFSRDRAASDVDPDGFNEFTATPEEVAQADAFEVANGIRPYTSAGQLQVPIQLGQIRKSVKREGKYGNHPTLDIPVNANGTVTLYFPTTNEDARRIVRERTLKGASGADRIYLTNESGVAKVMAKMGNIDQEVDGANVLVQVNPSMLHIDTEHEDGRKDFFIPIAEGQAFRERMSQVKLFTQNAPRTKGLSKSTTINDITAGIGGAVEAFKELTGMARRTRLKEAKTLLRKEHNVGTLLSVNGKLEKTNTGGYGLNNYDGKDVMSMGLGLASAQKINDEQKLTTCPQSAICESLCLGETSGQNLLYGGEGQFRSGPRMSQYLKTEAMVQNPEDFAIVLFSEIDRLQKNARRDDYQATVRLNVTSDFPPKVFEAIIKAFPEVMFYDYTKLNSATISPNHHLTYSSTGASQVVNGKTIVNPQTNWDAMVTKLNRGSNVAMAFTDKNTMPKFVVDGKTGQRFQVWNGDNYDARFLDPKRKDGVGMIVGLTNKDRTTKPEMAAEKHNGFFVDYNPERDGDVVVIPDQEALKAEAPKPVRIHRKSAPEREAAPAMFSRDRDTYNQRIAALKDLISCLKK